MPSNIKKENIHICLQLKINEGQSILFMGSQTSRQTNKYLFGKKGIKGTLLQIQK